MCFLGAGEASVSALMKFVPAQLPSSPQFRGLHVNLVVRGVNTSSLLPIGAPLTHAPLGSTVHVLIQVTSLDAVGKSTIRALMPGGLEPVDGNLDVDGELHFCCLLQCVTSTLLPLGCNTLGQALLFLLAQSNLLQNTFILLSVAFIDQSSSIVMQTGMCNVSLTCTP
jgi:hypothetical protein